MVFWETIDVANEPPVSAEYARIWRSADKVVYSRTLETPSSTRTRIERDFDLGTIRAMKESASRDISVGGAELAAQALKAGLVDEIRLIVTPVIVGGGQRALPDKVRVNLEPLDALRFSNGVVQLHYRTLR
jgi:dihydrofolate reductase